MQKIKELQNGMYMNGINAHTPHSTYYQVIYIQEGLRILKTQRDMKNTFLQLLEWTKGRVKKTKCSWLSKPWKMFSFVFSSKCFCFKLLKWKLRRQLEHQCPFCMLVYS